MSVEILQNCSLFSFILAAVFLLGAVVMFFVMDIPDVYGDISGRTARKAIDDIRRRNESSGDKVYKPSPVNASRGRTTERITNSGKLKDKEPGMVVSGQTEKIATAELSPASNETTLLDSTQNETTVLSFERNETTVLSSVGYGVVPVEFDESAGSMQGTFIVEVEMGFMGTQEIIE